MRVDIKVIAAIALGWTLITTPAAMTADGDIPSALQGKWALNGKCHVAHDLLEIGGNAITYAGQPAQPSQFTDGGPADGIIIDAPDDGDVGGLAYIKDGDRLLSYPEGFDAGSDAEYKRCK